MDRVEEQMRLTRELHRVELTEHREFMRQMIRRVERTGHEQWRELSRLNDELERQGVEGRAKSQMQRNAFLKVLDRLRITRPDNLSCTVGFSAYGKNGRRTVYRPLTAGHCNTTVWKQGGRRIGRTRVQKDFPGTSSDAQTITARRRRTSNKVFGPDFFRTLVGVERTRDQEHEGELVCISGAETGNSCGELKSTDHTQNREDGGERKHQRLARYNSEDGDSGAPVYRKVRGRRALAVGIHSGTVRCDFLFRNTCHVYSHASVIQKQFNLRICTRGRARCGR